MFFYIYGLLQDDVPVQHDIAICLHILSTFSLRLQMVHVHLSKVRDFWIIHKFLYNLNFLSASYLP